MADSPNKLSIEQLLDIYANSKEITPEELQPEVLQANDVLGFVSFYNIQPGPNTVTQETVWRLYQAWSSNPVKRLVFARRINPFIQTISRGQSRCYLLNESTLNLSNKTLKLLSSHIQDKRKNPHYKRHFEAYLNFYKFNEKVDGTWIESNVLFYLYDKWTYRNNCKNPLGRQTFVSFCKTYLGTPRRVRKITDSKVLFFQVNSNLYRHITEKEIKEIRDAHGEEEKIRKENLKEKARKAKEDKSKK